MTTSQIQVGYAIQRVSDEVALSFDDADGHTWDATDFSIYGSVTGYAFDAPDQESDIHFNVVEGALDDAFFSFFCWLGHADG